MASSPDSANLGKSRRFLTKPEEALLIEWVASKGENFGRYLDWCDKHEVPDGRRFSEAYFHIWVHRHRPQVQMARAKHTDIVRSESTMDREKRIALLEGQIARYLEDIRILTEHRDKIEEVIEDEQSGYSRYRAQKIPDVVESRLKVEEAMGKALDRIAKERGEYGGAEGKDTPGRNGEMVMMEQMLGKMGAKVALAAPQGRRPDDIDAEFTYVGPAVAGG